MNQKGTSVAIICRSVEFDKHLDRAWEIYEQNWIHNMFNSPHQEVVLSQLWITCDLGIQNEI